MEFAENVHVCISFCLGQNKSFRCILFSRSPLPGSAGPIFIQASSAENMPAVLRLGWPGQDAFLIKRPSTGWVRRGKRALPNAPSPRMFPT